MKTKLDLTKPVQTRDGRPVKIICTSATEEYPIAGVIASKVIPQSTQIFSFRADGSRYSYKTDDLDLINVPERLDLTQPVQLRNGNAARILCTDMNRDDHGWAIKPTVVVLVTWGVDGLQTVEYYDTKGQHYARHELAPTAVDWDLINVPQPTLVVNQPRRVWLNYYADRSPSAHPIKEAADMLAFSHRLECVEFVEVQK